MGGPTECARPRAVDLRRRRNARRNLRRNARGVSDARDRARGRVASTTTDSCAPSGRHLHCNRTWCLGQLYLVFGTSIVVFRDELSSVCRMASIPSHSIRSRASERSNGDASARRARARPPAHHGRAVERARQGAG
jgi:hypothetical protein